ncbi:hypothetical protein SNE40_015533 [Patella caerulea]|uniref:Peptidase S1 domain-containing protein n=1 Tax=Patella caerulea TaxID=87958 RepID=A0AAN8JKV1_PATCE
MAATILFGVLMTWSVTQCFGSPLTTSFVLCDYFGGVCGSNCALFYWHRFNISLCPTPGHLCCTQQPDNRVEHTDTLPETNDSNSPVLPDIPMKDEARQNTSSPAHLQEQCGNTPPIHRRKRVVGGTVANTDAWPWMVALRSVLGAHACAGAVIGSRWVLTAAHCFRYFSQPEYWRVRTGEYDLLQFEESERDIQISQIFVFPNYTSNDPGVNRENSTLHARYAHDLALIKLSEDAEVVPLCLPGEDQALPVTEEDPSGFRMAAVEAKGDCWVTGWGTTLDHSEDQVMRQVHSDVVDHERCGDMWQTTLEEDMICFGDGIRGPCAGDSGGPLACRMDGKFFMVGVVSWGAENCNMNGHPSVFARVLSHMDWIEATMNGSRL